MLLNLTPYVTLLLLSQSTGRSSAFNLGAVPTRTNNAQISKRSPITALGVQVGLGPGEGTKEKDKSLYQGRPEIFYEEPDHELFRQSRMTKFDKKSDAWFSTLLGTTPSLGRVSQQTLDTIHTPVPLKDEVRLPPSDPKFTAYVTKLRQPGAPIVPAYGCENYSLPTPRRRAEAWRQFDVLGMIETDYSQLPDGYGTDLTLDAATSAKYESMFKSQNAWLDESSCSARLVYINGRFCPSLSMTTSIAKNLTPEDLVDAREEIIHSLLHLPDGYTDTLEGDLKAVRKECGTNSLAQLSAPHHNTGPASSQFAVNNQQGMACFAALNSVRAGSVAFVDVPKNHIEELPILIVNGITKGGGVLENDSESQHSKGVTQHPRTLILADEFSQSSVIQSSIDLDIILENEITTVIPPKLHNGYTQVYVQKNATVAHSYIEETGGIPTANVDRSGSQYDAAREAEAKRPGLRDTHMECIMVQLLSEGSVYKGTMMGIGGCGRSKLAMTTTLLAPDCHSEINGLSLSGGEQTVDMRTTIHHIAHGTTSEQAQKNMVGGRATATFKGRIRVEQSAQQTESDQLARALLLSDRAKIWSIPSLEIIADDVKCTHGATISDLSEEELFYLRSRGLSRTQARNMIMYAFVDNIGMGVDRGFLYGEGMLKDRIVARLENLVPRGDRAMKGEFQSV